MFGSVVLTHRESLALSHSLVNVRVVIEIGCRTLQNPIAFLFPFPFLFLPKLLRRSSNMRMVFFLKRFVFKLKLVC